MQSDFQQRAEELYQAGVADGFRAGFVNTLKKALEEAALSAAEPVGEVAGQQGRYWMTDEGRWSNWFDITFNTWVPEPGVREVRNLYAAPPAPSVAVKELEWSPRNDQPQYEVCADTPFGRYKTSNKGEYGFGWMQPRQTVWSGFLPTLEEAKAAAQSHYESRIRSALSAQVQDADEQRTETCQRCQGNGEIVTDWERYRHLHENDVGDEAVAECPDCDGIGKVSAQVQEVAGWQPIENAPKDGRTILAYFPLEGLGKDWERVMPVKYRESMMPEPWIFAGRAASSYSTGPTHWMPLPCSPQHPQSRRAEA